MLETNARRKSHITKWYFYPSRITTKNSIPRNSSQHGSEVYMASVTRKTRRFIHSVAASWTSFLDGKLRIVNMPYLSERGDIVS